MITVRPVTSVDVPGVVALVRDTLAEFGLRFGEGSKTDAELAGLPGSYENAGGAFWVAVNEGGRVMGTCGVFPVAPSDMELRKMYLHPDSRGTGLGKRLLEESIAWCRARGAGRIVRDDEQVRGSRCSRGYARRL